MEAAASLGNHSEDKRLNVTGGSQRCVDQRASIEAMPGKINRGACRFAHEWSGVAKVCRNRSSGQVQALWDLRDVREAGVELFEIPRRREAHVLPVTIDDSSNGASYSEHG